MENLKLDKDFIKKFKLNDLLIKEMKFWLISLRPEQPTLGSLIISLKRPSDKMSDLLPEETEELAQVFKLIENALKNTFKPDKMNYLVLMMVDNQVHYHVIPRYENDRTLNEMKFKDENWPMPPSFKAQEINEKGLLEILSIFKTHIV